MWGPLSAITTFNLPMDLAGAGSGVYNTSRQVGAVLGSASITALMASRLSAEIGTGDFSGGGAGQLPEPLREGFALAMGQSLLLPVAVIAARCGAHTALRTAAAAHWPGSRDGEPREVCLGSRRGAGRIGRLSRRFARASGYAQVMSMGGGGGGRGGRVSGGDFAAQRKLNEAAPKVERLGGRIAELFQPYKGPLAAIIVLVLFSAALGIMPPLITQRVFDDGLFPVDWRRARTCPCLLGSSGS